MLANRLVLFKTSILELSLHEKKNPRWISGEVALDSGYLTFPLQAAGVGLLHNVNGTFAGTPGPGVAPGGPQIRPPLPSHRERARASKGPGEARGRCRGRRQRAPAAPRPLDGPRGGATGSREIVEEQAPVGSMADSLLLFKRGPSRSTWLRARKARPHLILSYRPRRRLGRLRWRSRRRFRRRLLQAQAAGVDWREGGCLVSRAAAPRRPKTAAPSPRLAKDPAPSCSAILPIPPVRSAGSGRAVLLLPLGQVGRARGAGRAEREG